MKKTCPFNISSETIRILWEITSKCNLKCKHCLYYDNNKNSSQKDLPFPDVSRIIDKIADNGNIKEIWLSGGEPLLRSDLFDIIRYIRLAGMMPSLSSNAVLITDSIAKELYNSGIRYVHVSLDGTNAETHDELRQVQGAFEKALNGINQLNSVGIMTGASFIVTDNSIDQVETMLELAQSLELSVMSFYQAEPLGRAVGKCFGDRNAISQKLRQIQSEIKTHGTCFKGKIEFQRLFDDETDYLEECHGDRFLTITSNGKLGVCPWLMKSKLRFFAADLLNDDFNEGIDKCKQYMFNLRLKRKQYIKCKECQFIDMCGQGCPATSITSEKYPYGFECVCSIGEQL